MLKICMVGPFDPALCDGVSASMFELFQFLRGQGHDVSFISFMHDTPLCRERLEYLHGLHGADILARGENFCDATYRGVRIHYEILPFKRGAMLACHPKVLHRVVEKLNEAEECFIMTVDSDLTSLTARVITGAHGAHFFHSGPCVRSFAGQPVHTSILRHSTVFAVSEFMRGKIERQLKVKSVVWPPFIDIDKCCSGTNPGLSKVIGYYSAGPHKGDAIVRRLIEEMHDHRFIVIGRNCSFVHEPSLFPNLNFRGDVTDLKSFYGDISLLIVPSLLEEAYPRVILEAAVNGIPVIANNIGGIPEALGDSGILVEMEDSVDAMADKYFVAIDQILTNPDVYSTFREKALKRSEKYKEEILDISMVNTQRYLQ